MAFTIPTIFKAIDQLSAPVRRMAAAVQSFGEKTSERFKNIDWKGISDGASEIAKKATIAGLAILAPLGLMANEAMKFEDIMADVGKTTKLSGVNLQKFGQDLLSMSGDTRTSIEDLAKIAEIGGQLGVDQGDLLGFTGAVDKFNVALGKDFSGGVEEAASQVGKIKTLFQDTSSLNIADAITKTGSAINELGAVGAGTSANITEFALRMGQLPTALKPSLTDTLALGTFLEESGLSAEIASGGLTKFFLVAGENIGKFAKQMGISTDSARELLSTKPTEFAKQFAGSLQNMKPDELAKTLGKLGIGTQETIKVLGALGSNIERVTKLQVISNNSFTQGTSLLDEFNKKNETTAAKLQKAQNNLKALAIIVGTELLPVITSILSKFIPIIKWVVTWAKENPILAKTLTFIALGLGVLVTLIGVFSGAIALASEAMLVFNSVMALNPIVWIIAGITALIALITIIILRFNDWGAAINTILGIFLPGLALIISLIMTFKNNWDRIVDAFSSGNILDGLIAIGSTLLDVVLAPLQQILEIISNITGVDWAANAAKGIEDLRRELGVTMDNQSMVVNPEAERQKNYVELIDKKQQNINMTINDKTGRATMESDNNIFFPRLTSTQ